MSLFPHIIFFCLIGLCLGSFASAIVYRVPRGERLTGRSHCPECNVTLRFIDLLPVVSFLLLRGKCHSCRAPISLRYPLIEIITAVIFTFFFLTHLTTEWWGIVLLGIAIFALILVSFCDLATKRIPDAFTLLLALSALLYHATGAMPVDTVLRDALPGAAIPFLFFGLLWFMSSGRWIGSGDILLGGAIGLLLGLKLTFVMLFVTYVVGAFVAMALLASGIVRSDTHIPFGPFLSAGALVALFFGDSLIKLYLSLLS